MTKAESEKLKLAFIHLLSKENVDIESFEFDNKVIATKPEQGWKTFKSTGESTFVITLKRNKK